MKQPKFLYEGEYYPVAAINFHEDGSLCHIYFTQGRQGITAFQKRFEFESKVIRKGIVHLDLYECLKLQSEGTE